MSKLTEEIRKKMDALQAGMPQSLAAKVVEVAEETCTLNFDGLKIYDVKLRASENSENSKFLVKPKVGSWVMMSRIHHSKNFYVSMFSEVDQVYVTSNLFQFNSGELGGLIKIEKLVSRLNVVEEDLNTLKSLLTEWVPAANDGGLALKAKLLQSVPPYVSSTIEKTKVTDLENKKITHG